LIAIFQRIPTSSVNPPPSSVAPIRTLTVKAGDAMLVDSLYFAAQ
jgi:hypothetical protein